MLSDKELKHLALQVFKGEVFTSHQVQDKKDIPMVFLPIALLTEEQRKELIAKKPVMFYEEIDKAGPSVVNGQPCFPSMKWLNRTETEKFNGYFLEIEKAVGLVMQSGG